MQLPEAKAMSEWLARYIVIRIQSKSKSRSRARNKYHVSVIPGMEESCYLDLENNNNNNNNNNNILII